LEDTRYVISQRGLEIKPLPGAQVLAHVEAVYFNRTWRHFCSHLYTPSSKRPAYPLIVRNGGVIYFAHPICRGYDAQAQRWSKRLLRNAVEMLLPDSLVRHEGPSMLQVTFNHQAEHNRSVLHLLHYIPERRCAAFDVI